MPGEAEAQGEHTEEKLEKTTEEVASVAKEEASLSHELSKLISERMDLMTGEMGSQFGRVHEKLDSHEVRLNELAAKAEKQTDTTQESAGETTGEVVQPVAAELHIEPVKDAQAGKAEKVKRGKRGKAKRTR